MPMLSRSSPRRVYCRNGVTHVLYAGGVFGTQSATPIRTDHPVRIKGEGDGTITVSQRINHSKAVVETWSIVKV